MHVKNPMQSHRTTFLNQFLTSSPVTSKKTWSVTYILFPELTDSSFPLQQLTETCDATDATESKPRREQGLSHAILMSQTLECRRASQEDMALEDTASQQSLSEEQ